VTFAKIPSQERKILAPQNVGEEKNSNSNPKPKITAIK